MPPRLVWPRVEQETTFPEAWTERIVMDAERMDVAEFRLQQHEKQLEAQGAKLDRIEGAIGDLRVSLARMEAGLASIAGSVAGLRATVILTGLGAVALIVAVLAYGQTWFGIGLSARDIVRATVVEMRQASPKP